MSATVNGEAVNVVAAPDSAQFLLNISASGKSTTTRLAAHPGAVLLPDFDPGALETLLTLAVTQNNRDLWAILPKQAGSIEPVQLATYPDQEGTLDGKPITVHHMVATIAGDEYRSFLRAGESAAAGRACRSQGFALIRKGFVLTPPAKPIVPTIGDAGRATGTTELSESDGPINPKCAHDASNYQTSPHPQRYSENDGGSTYTGDALDCPHSPPCAGPQLSWLRWRRSLSACASGAQVSREDPPENSGRGNPHVLRRASRALPRDVHRSVDAPTQHRGAEKQTPEEVGRARALRSRAPARANRTTQPDDTWRSTRRHARSVRVSATVELTPARYRAPAAVEGAATPPDRTYRTRERRRSGSGRSRDRFAARWRATESRMQRRRESAELRSRTCRAGGMICDDAGTCRWNRHDRN